MGRRNREHREAVASGKSKPLREKMRAQANLLLISQAINSGAITRERLLEGAKKGIEDHVRKLIKEQKPLTSVTALEEIAGQEGFFRVVARIGITKADLEALALEVIDATNKGADMVATVSTDTCAHGV